MTAGMEKAPLRVSGRSLDEELAISLRCGRSTAALMAVYDPITAAK
jgi:hypothetical protein